MESIDTKEQQIRKLVAELIQQRMNDAGESIDTVLLGVIEEINKVLEDIGAIAVLQDGDPPCIYFTTKA